MTKPKPSDKELRQRLSSLEYHVTQERGTERAFTGKYTDHKALGTYHCIVCDAELFSSDTKFDSHCGWPSFWLPLAGERVQTHRDSSHGMVRTEVTCTNCGAHLGHVFIGERLTKKNTRHCVNSISMKFIPAPADK